MDWKTITLPLTATTPILFSDKNGRDDRHADHANGNADKKGHVDHHGDHADKNGDENHADKLSEELTKVACSNKTRLLAGGSVIFVNDS